MYTGVGPGGPAWTATFDFYCVYAVKINDVNPKPLREKNERNENNLPSGRSLFIFAVYTTENRRSQPQAAKACELILDFVNPPGSDHDPFFGAFLMKKDYPLFLRKSLFYLSETVILEIRREPMEG